MSAYDLIRTEIFKKGVNVVLYEREWYQRFVLLLPLSEFSSISGFQLGSVSPRLHPSCSASSCLSGSSMVEHGLHGYWFYVVKLLAEPPVQLKDCSAEKWLALTMWKLEAPVQLVVPVVWQNLVRQCWGHWLPEEVNGLHRSCVTCKDHERCWSSSHRLQLENNNSCIWSQCTAEIRVACPQSCRNRFRGKVYQLLDQRLEQQGVEECGAGRSYPLKLWARFHEQQLVE